MGQSKPNSYKIPSWAYRLPWDQIVKTASFHKIPSQLFASIIMTESSGNQNPKPRFEAKWDRFVAPSIYAINLGISLDEEVRNQATSWGMCQVMGAVMRENGYGGHLDDSVDIATNLQYGAIKLAECLRKWPYWYSAASAYNGGHPLLVQGKIHVYVNAAYVDKVKSYLKSFGMPDQPLDLPPS